jgi:hypothetical protein
LPSSKPSLEPSSVPSSIVASSLPSGVPSGIPSLMPSQLTPDRAIQGALETATAMIDNISVTKRGKQTLRTKKSG